MLLLALWLLLLCGYPLKCLNNSAPASSIASSRIWFVLGKLYETIWSSCFVFCHIPSLLSRIALHSRSKALPVIFCFRGCALVAAPCPTDPCFRGKTLYRKLFIPSAGALLFPRSFQNQNQNQLRWPVFVSFGSLSIVGLESIINWTVS